MFNYYLNAFPINSNADQKQRIQVIKLYNYMSR